MQPASFRKQIQYVRQTDHPTQPSRHMLPRHCRSGDGWSRAEGLERRIGLREGSGDVLGVCDGWMSDGDWGGVGGWAKSGSRRRGGGWSGTFYYPHSGKQSVCGVKIDEKERLINTCGLL